VLGSGAIGLLFASSIRMAFPSYPITMLVRPHHRCRLTNDNDEKSSRCYMDVSVTQPPSLQSSRSRIRWTRIPAMVIGDTHNLSSTSRKISNIWLTTKAFDAKTALRGIESQFSPSGVHVYMLCNGALGLREELECIWPRISWSYVSTTHGAVYDSEDNGAYHVTHAGLGRTYVSQSDSSLVGLLDRAGLNAELTDNMDMTLWYKLAANCVINPGTALWKCRNGDLPSQTNFPDFCDQILEEIVSVCPLSQLNMTVLRQYVHQVIADTKLNKSSMLQDIESGRKTEVDYLNGYIVKKGMELGIRTPANYDMCERIKALY
jgi:2-dehydropantoate 2-reductase